jgi:hypothetical protein
MVVNSAAVLGSITPGSGERFTLVLDPDTALEEIVYATSPSSPSSTTITIIRGVDGTGTEGVSGVAHSAGAKVRHMAIGVDFREANNHIKNETTAHGLTIADVITTTNTKTITNKTISAADNTLTGVTTLTATQTLTNKTLTTPTITSPTITGTGAIAGTFTGNITGNVTGNLTGNVTGNVTGSSGSTTGNAATATALATGRTISLTGDVSGTSASFDGTANASITVAYAANSIVNDDINASAGIALSKLATDPLARANHTGTQTASTISNFDTQVRTSRLDQMAAPTAAVSVNSQKITNLDTPTSSADAANKLYVDTQITNLIGGAPGTLDTLDEIAAALADTANFSDTVVLKSGSTMTGALAMGTNKITGLGTPTASTDAATKGYIDTTVLAPSNLTGPITSVGNVTSIASQTGTGTKFVVDNTPTLITPVLGVATATSINGTTIPTSKTLVATDSTEYVVPSQTGNSGKYLTTNGTVSSWGVVDALPSQTGNAGKYLTTNGTAASWETVTTDPTADIFMMMGA